MAIASLGLGCSTGSSTKRPNVLYVSVDDLGTTLNVYGNPQVITPNVDQFATRSVVFDRCYCQVAICSASRTSILTGVRPETSGIVALEHDWQTVLPAPGTELSDAAARDMTARYFAEMTDVDRAFGEILSTLDELGLRDDTIVIFWSGDHGFHLGTNDRWGKWSNLDASTRVPLLMSVPGVSADGSRARGLVECVDMYPTLVELCGLSDAVHELDGLSFAPVLESPDIDWKHSAFSVFGVNRISNRSIKTPQYNYIEQRLPFMPPNFSLYDLVDDPDETTNLYETEPEIVSVLADRLERGFTEAVPTGPPIVFD
ncbi:MAG: sulfatase-like hydrolase/transferase [Acidimicrobiia bacterium]|nr:sulfatase-like hydrolase/transferase [Acidimicrobiia bacterium]